MRYPISFFLLLSCGSVAFAQDAPPQSPPVIENVEISGVRETRISTALWEDIQKLPGQIFDQKRIDELTDRIQSEFPEFVAATRQMPGTAPDRINLIFVVAEIDEEEGPNINSRYTVESAEITGISESQISEDVRKEVQDLVGKRLDQRETERLRHRIYREVRPRFRVKRRVIRGSERSQIRVIFEIEKQPWIKFGIRPPSVIYHSKQGLSAENDLSVSYGNSSQVRFGAAATQDPLIERFLGFRIGYENRSVVNERFGVKLDFFTYRQKWEPTTLLASRTASGAPGIYRARLGFEPAVAFAIDPRVTISVGASLNDIEMQDPNIHSRTASAGIASLNVEHEEGRHKFDGSYRVRAATHKLDSDFVYTRHFGDARYRFRQGDNRFTARFLAGRLTGSAPLFERFSLGNSETLRGWNKFDLAPLGTSRVVHGSLEHRYRGFQVFYDVGALWDRGQPIQARQAAGLGFGDGDDWFILLGFPIRSNGVKPLLTMGLRF